MAKSVGRGVVHPDVKPSNVLANEFEERVAETLTGAGFEVERPPRNTVPVVDFIARGDVAQTTFTFLVEVKLEIRSFTQVEKIYESCAELLKRDERMELWIVATRLHPSVKDGREVFQRGVRVMTFEEFVERAGNWMHVGEIKPPRRKKRTPRTSVGRAMVQNAGQIGAATTTAVAMIDNRLQQLAVHRPNSKNSIKDKDDEISRLRELKKQAEIIRTQPEAIEEGTIDEREAVESAGLFAKRVAEYWKKHSDTICSNVMNLGLFSSLALVGHLIGAPPALTYSLAGVMAYGKPVVDALKAMKGIFKRGD